MAVEEQDIIAKLTKTDKKTSEKPKDANYNYPIDKFQIPELPLLSDIDKLPDNYSTDLDIKKVISFNLVYDRDNNKWVFQEASSGGGGSGGSSLKTPTIVNMSVATGVWTKLADLPNNVGTWTIKSTDNNFLFRLNFTGAGTYLTINSGIIYSEDTNPSAIWVWQNQGVAKDFELIYWT